jgi:hypothetical protein
MRAVVVTSQFRLKRYKKHVSVNSSFVVEAVNAFFTFQLLLLTMPPLIKSDPKFPRLDNIRIHLPQGNTIAQSKFNPEYRLYSDIALSDIHPMKLTGKSCVYHGI